jgi:hypothetical protein
MAEKCFQSSIIQENPMEFIRCFLIKINVCKFENENELN